MTDHVAETTALLTMLVRALVQKRDAVSVTPTTQPEGKVIFRVLVDASEKGKVIGKQGRTAGSLRILLTAVAKENGMDFLLDIDSFDVGADGGMIAAGIKPPFWERRP